MKQLSSKLEAEIDSRLLPERELRREITTMNENLRKFKEKLISLEAELYKVIITNTAIRNKFVIYQMKMMNIADSSIKGKIHPDSFPLLNKTLPNHEQYPYEEMVPLSCVHEEHSKNVLFRMQIKKVSQKTVVVAADPFFPED